MGLRVRCGHNARADLDVCVQMTDDPLLGSNSGFQFGWSV